MLQAERGERGRDVERTTGGAHRVASAGRPPLAHRLATPVRGRHRPHRVQRDRGRGRGQPSGERGRVVHRRYAQRGAGRGQEKVPVRAGEGHTQCQVHTASLAASGRVQHGNVFIPGHVGPTLQILRVIDFLS